jgi:(S)-ureidoglycine aminohydrolase
MRRVDQLVSGRTFVGGRAALMPLEGFPVSRLPGWGDASVRVLISPAMGAEFVQVLIELPAGKSGKWAAAAGVETFVYVLSGVGVVNGKKVTSGGFALLPPKTAVSAKAGEEGLSLMVFRKRYEAAAGVPMFKPVFGNEAAVERKMWAENPHSLLQTLIPDEIAYDMAINIFTFSPGYGLPIIETHVMEHGAMILQGKGLYYLEDRWVEVERDDVIWMGPYCPQSFYATGPTAARYIYYKNVNREILI